MTGETERRDCGRHKPHSTHQFMLGRKVYQCPGVAQSDAGYCPNCGRGDCAPNADECEQARQRAARFQARLDAARAWGRQHLDAEQQAGLLSALRGDTTI